MRTKLVLSSALVTVAALAVAVPAGADNLGRAGPVRYVAKSVTLTSATDGAHAQANCPVGWKAVSGGATIKPGATRGLDWNDKDPGASSRGWYASAWQSSSKSTTLRTFGVCLQTALTVDTASKFGVSPGAVTVTATCPSGSIVVGGGGRPIGPMGEWTLNASRNIDGPDVDPSPNDAWQAYYHYDGSDGDGLLVDAICVGSVGEPAYRDTSTSILPRSTKTVRSSCGSGEHVLGGGAYITGSTASARVAGSRPFDSGDAGTVPDDGWLATYRNTSDTALTAYAHSICS